MTVKHRLLLYFSFAAMAVSALLSSDVRAADLQWGSGGAGGAGTCDTTSSNRLL
jgi:hypothetical protein